MKLTTDNLDPTEIEKFTLHAAQWWDPTGPCKPLHAINPLRLQFIRSCMALTNKKIIDVGCGGGILSESLAKHGASVTAIDMNEAVLKVARLHLLESNLSVDYQQISVEELAEQSPQTFDAVTCMELLEHVPDPVSIVKACSILLKPGGHVFFSTINRNWQSYLYAIIGVEYFLNLLEKGTHDYSKFICPSELDAWARSADLTIKKITGITYNPLTQHYSLCDSIAVNYIAHYQREL